jgi:hypothetical protein
VLAWVAQVGGGGAGSGEYRLNNPLGVEYDAAARRLYVADSGNGRVQVYMMSISAAGDTHCHFEK